MELGILHLVLCTHLSAELWRGNTLNQMLPSGEDLGYIGFDQDFSRQTSLLYWVSVKLEISAKYLPLQVFEVYISLGK